MNGVSPIFSFHCTKIWPSVTTQFCFRIRIYKRCEKSVQNNQRRNIKKWQQEAGGPLSAPENKCEGGAIVSLSVHQTNLESVWEDFCTAGWLWRSCHWYYWFCNIILSKTAVCLLCLAWRRTGRLWLLGSLSVSIIREYHKTVNSLCSITTHERLKRLPHVWNLLHNHLNGDAEENSP